MPGETVVGQVILDADVQVSSLVEHVQRPVPLIVGKQVQHEQLRFREIILLGRDGEFDLIGNFIGIFGIQDAGPNDILFVHGNEEPARYQVVHLASAGQGNLGLRVLEDGHDVGNRQGLLAGIVDGNVFVGAVQILLRTHGQVQRSRFVHGVFHLVDVPVGSQQGRVDNPHIRTDVFHLLRVPEREGIVIAVGDEDAVFPDRFQVVAGEFHRGVAVAAVVIVPVFGRHDGGRSQAAQRGECGNGNAAPAF